MKLMGTLSLLLILNILYSSLLYAPCNQGTLTAVSGSPYSIGSQPLYIAYSPLIAGNEFVAVANDGGSSVSVFSVNTSTGVLTAVSGSPFTVGSSPVGVAFSPVVYGNLFAAVANLSSNTISVFSVNSATGVFTAVSGSPFAATAPYGIAFSPLINGNLFVMAADNSGNAVSVFSVNTITGALTAVSGSPFAAGVGPRGVAFSPVVNGNLFAAVANTPANSATVYKVNTSTGVLTSTGTVSPGGNPFNVTFSPILSNNLYLAIPSQSNSQISVYSINTSTGVPTQISGSPFATGSNPSIAAYSSIVAGNVYAAVNNQAATPSVSVYQVNTSTGGFTQVSGSPFTTGVGTTPYGIAFSPQLSGGLFAAVANEGSNTASVFQVATLIPTLTTLSQFILSGASVTLNGTITGGTQPYAITWQDSTVQSGIAVSTFSRTVSPTSTTIYDVATISDTNACTAGPSNSVTISVRTCP